MLTVELSTLGHLKIIEAFVTLGREGRTCLPKLRIEVETLKLLNSGIRYLIELSLLRRGICIQW